MAVWLVLPFVLVHFYAGACLARIVKSTRAGTQWWAWVPLLNLLLPFRLAGRSVLWGVLFLLPPVNVVIWTLVWCDVCGRLQRPRWLALGMPVPLVNLALLGHLAGLTPPRLGLAFGLIVSSIPLATMSHAARHRVRLRDHIQGLHDADPSVRRRAASALASAREAGSVAALARALEDSDAGVRSEAARALGQLGPAAAPAAPALVGAMEDESSVVRGRAARALSAIAHEPVAAPDITVRALLEGVRGSGEALMPDAGLVDALAILGPPAVPHVVVALQDGDAGVRWHAAAALMRLGHAASETTPALLAAMNDAQWPVRNAAGRALEEVVVKSAVPALAEALRNPSAETRYHVARALARVGPGAAPATQTLTQILADEDWEVRMEAAWALAAIGPAARDAVPALIVALRDGNTEVRRSAAWSIGHVGGAQAAASALREALKDPDREVRDAAARVLERIGERSGVMKSKK